MLQAVTAATQERRTFAIDEAKEDEETEGDPGPEDDAGVMDEVCISTLNDSIAQLNTFRSRLMLSFRPTTQVSQRPIRRWPRNC